MIEGLELAIGWHQRQAARLRSSKSGNVTLDEMTEARAKWHDEAADALTRIALS